MWMKQGEKTEKMGKKKTMTVIEKYVRQKKKCRVVGGGETRRDKELQTLKELVELTKNSKQTKNLLAVK